MNDRNLSKSDLDLSNGDLSTETSLHTDALSNLDFDETSLKLFNGGKSIIENKQLIHDVQLLKVKLSEKDILLNNINLEYTNKIEYLEERLHDALQQNQMLSARLNGVVNIHNDEQKQMQEQVKIELSRILLRQKELEENNDRFMKNEYDIKNDLRHIEISEMEYEALANKHQDSLTIRQFVCLRVHELMKPLKSCLEQTLKENKQFKSAVKHHQEEINQLRKECEDEKRKHHTDVIDSQKLYYELADTKALLQQANFKRDNYDRTKYERDEYERKYTEAETNVAQLSATLKVLTKERDDFMRELSQFKQEIQLLKQDKDYLYKQYIDVQNKYTLNENKVDNLSVQLDEMKKSREEIYEKYVNSKEIYKNEYDSKLSAELEQLRSKTQHELEKLRTNTKEFYERENRALKEARDIALSDKDKAESEYRELNRKFNELMNDLRVLQLNSDNKLSEVKGELKLKSFELDRLAMLNDENLSNYRKVCLDNERLNKKIEVIQNEYFGLKIQNEKNLVELESRLSEKTSRLENYEKLEREMDEVILQAAESDNNEEAEKLLFSYGYGANIVTSAKRRLQQNVHLTRRILHLEKLNTSLRHEIEREREHAKELSDELHATKCLIEHSKQPQEYFINLMQAKEVQLKKQKGIIDKLHKQVDELTIEKDKLVKAQNEMTGDIEKLIRHNEELFSIREELEKKCSIMSTNKPTKMIAKSVSSLSNKNKKQIKAESLDVLHFDQPEPLLFTKTKPNNPQPVQRVKQPQQPETHKRVYTIDKS